MSNMSNHSTLYQTLSKVSLLIRSNLSKVLCCPLYTLVHLNSRRYFEEYFTSVDLIKSQDRWTLRWAQFSYYLCLQLKTCHYFCLWWFQGRLPPAGHLLNFDIVSVEGFLPVLNAYISVNFILLALMFKQLFYRNVGYTGDFLREILLDKENHSLQSGNAASTSKHFYFLSLQFSRPLNALFLKVFHHDLNKSRVEASLQKGAMIILLGVDVLAFFYFSFISLNYAQLLKNLLELLSTNCSDGIATFLHLTTYHLVVLHFLQVISISRRVLSLVGVFISLLALTTWLRLKELKQFTANLKAKNRTFTEAEFTFIRRHFAVPLLRWLADLNRIYGPLISGFILSTLPLNALLTMLLAFGRLKLLYRVVVYVFGAIQALFLFGLTLFAAKLAAEYQKVTKRVLIHFYLLSSKTAGKQLEAGGSSMTMFRLQLSHFIVRFHTNNPYTLNLGKVGKLNFRMFGRILFFYFKFLIFAYKLMMVAK